jgi:hypothetical protein
LSQTASSGLLDAWLLHTAILQPFKKDQRLGTSQSFGTMVHACHQATTGVFVQIMNGFSHRLASKRSAGAVCGIASNSRRPDF